MSDHQMLVNRKTGFYDILCTIHLASVDRNDLFDLIHPFGKRFLRYKQGGAGISPVSFLIELNCNGVRDLPGVCLPTTG